MITIPIFLCIFKFEIWTNSTVFASFGHALLFLALFFIVWICLTSLNIFSVCVCVCTRTQQARTHAAGTYARTHARIFVCGYPFCTCVCLKLKVDSFSQSFSILFYFLHRVFNCFPSTNTSRHYLWTHQPCRPAKQATNSKNNL